jgi:hypothetical protein
LIIIENELDAVMNSWPCRTGFRRPEHQVMR